PTRGRFKVYLIDEVHMLSTSSFNALLKTLEEPPPHVKFLLATTDPQKLPVTVLSRCLQFNLKRLPAGLIAERMERILDAEGVTYEGAGVRLVALAADGSVRDGLSLLDQLIAFGGGRVGEAEARAMLGTVSRDHVLALAERLAGLDARELLRYARELEQWAPDHAQLLDELAALLTRVALRQAVPDLPDDELYPTAIVQKLASALAPEDVQLFYQIAILGRRDLPLAPDPRSGFEMTLLRMAAFRPGDGAGPALSRPARQTAGADAGIAAAPAAAAAGGPAPGRGTGSDGSWGAIVAQLELQGAARQLASNCSLIGRQAGLVRLALDPRHQLVKTRAMEDKLAQALSRFYGETVRIEIAVAEERPETPAEAKQRDSHAQLEAAREVLEQDGTVRGLKERFGATVLPETVRPLK